MSYLHLYFSWHLTLFSYATAFHIFYFNCFITIERFIPSFFAVNRTDFTCHSIHHMLILCCCKTVCCSVSEIKSSYPHCVLLRKTLWESLQLYDYLVWPYSPDAMSLFNHALLPCCIFERSSLNLSLSLSIDWPYVDPSDLNHAPYSNDQRSLENNAYAPNVIFGTDLVTRGW